MILGPSLENLVVIHVTNLEVSRNLLKRLRGSLQSSHPTHNLRVFLFPRIQYHFPIYRLFFINLSLWFTTRPPYAKVVKVATDNSTQVELEVAFFEEAKNYFK